jgi:hypothetical protein
MHAHANASIADLFRTLMLVLLTHRVADAQQSQPDLDGPGFFVGAFGSGAAIIRPLAAGTLNRLLAAEQPDIRIRPFDVPNDVEHFFSEELAHRRQHLPLLVHWRFTLM